MLGEKVSDMNDDRLGSDVKIGTKNVAGSELETKLNTDIGGSDAEKQCVTTD